MIIDLLSNAGLYGGLAPGLVEALHWLANTDPLALPVGKTEIHGDRLFAMVQDYDTKPRDKCRWEAHRRYHDVQFVARGVEQIGWTNLANVKVAEAYDEAKDVGFFDGEGDLVTVRTGTFTIFTPQDVHAPGAALHGPVGVRKIVVKVAV
jgi:YhcH/YjgK/YiaL family protein